MALEWCGVGIANLIVMTGHHRKMVSLSQRD
jgi:hypothetical protein